MKVLNGYKIIFLILMLFKMANANDVEVLAVDLYAEADNVWRIKATLSHTDKGWGHYANAFQVEDAVGMVFGSRRLAHPHADEQPFTRELVEVKIPKEVTTVFIKANDSVHGWTKHGLRVDLTKVEKGHLRVEKVIPNMTKRRFTKEGFQQGAPINGQLISWMDKNAGSMRFQMPVDITTDSVGGIASAYLRADKTKIKIYLNTGAMSMRLHTRLEPYCTSHPCTVRLWLEGTWGALVKSPLNKKSIPIFSVFGLVGIASAEENNIHVPMSKLGVTTVLSE